MVHVKVRTFGQLREALGCDELHLDLPVRSTISDAWDLLVARATTLEKFASTTRAARNGAVAAYFDTLNDGDDVAFLPPFGGG